MKIVKEVSSRLYNDGLFIKFQGVDSKGKRLFARDAEVMLGEDKKYYTVSFGSSSGDIKYQEERLLVINEAFKQARRLNKLIK